MTVSPELLEPSAGPLVQAILPGPRTIEPSGTEVLRVMYGETFDEFPAPIDAYKYYSWLVIVAREVARSGGEIRCSVVVADDAVRTNKSGEWGETLIVDRCERRVEQIETFIEGCFGDTLVHVDLMSDVRKSTRFASRRSRAEELLKSSETFADIIAASVRPDRRAGEAANGFAYSLDEAALVSSFAYKVGPPREQHYDDAARLLSGTEGGPGLVSILLMPDYPLALGPGAFVRNEELARYGATPYKSNSHGWRNNRLTPGVTTPADAQALISRTRLMRRPNVPNPLLSIATTLQLVSWALDGAKPTAWLADEWDQHRLSDDELRSRVLELYRRLSLQI